MQLKKIFASLLTSLIFLAAPANGAKAIDLPQIDCESFILTDAKTGDVLCEKNSQNRMMPASTTKIMTAILVLENLDLNKDVTVPKSVIDALQPGISHIELKPGEIIPVKSLLYGLLIASGNDAANVLAIEVSGNIESFVNLMNQRAKEIGALNTNFVNPDGFPDENHYTTAEDLAIIGRFAMQNPVFCEIVKLAHIKIPETNMTPERYYINSNNLVSRYRFKDYFYDKAVGIKTGSTKEAGFCLVSAAKSGEKELIGVVLKAKDVAGSHFGSRDLLEFGFNNFENFALSETGDLITEVKVKYGRKKDFVRLMATDSFSKLLPKGTKKEEIKTELDLPQKVSAPIKKGEILGRKNFYYAEKLIGIVDLEAEESISCGIFGTLKKTVAWVFNLTLVKIILKILAVLFLLYGALFSAALFRRQKNKKRKRYKNRKKY